MTKNKIMWGIIGCGKIAHKVASDFTHLSNAKLVAVASRDQKRSEEFGAQYGVTKCYTSYEALAKDPEVDVIYIATIHPQHAAATLLCIHHGKAVMCEKPLGMNAEEVKKMIDAAQSQKLFLLEAIWTRFMPIIQHALALVAEGRIGEVKMLHADFGFKANVEVTRLFEKKLGGGSLLDIGIYPLFISLAVLGMPHTVKATASMKNGVDESCGMLLSYENGATAVLSSTLAADTPTEAWIHGTEGAIKLHSRFHNPTKLSLWKDAEIQEELDMPILGNGYSYEISHVSDCIQQGLTESPLLPHGFSLNLVQLLDEVRDQIGLEY